MDPGTLATILSIGTIVLGAATGLVGLVLGRRSASGRVGTSEAAVLWQQAQDMRAMLLAEKQKAEEQRDKFIASYTEQVLPVLTSINHLVTEMAVAVSGNTTAIRQVAAFIQGGDHNAEVSPAQPRSG